MKLKLFVLTCIAFSLLNFQTSYGQVTITNKTNTTPSLNDTYPSLGSAIAALNNITSISGPVKITLDPGYPETAPLGGFSINFANITNTASSPITITGSGNTITAFSPQVSGSITDAIFKIIGADYITIEDFVMQENAGNTTTSIATNNLTEWGIALLYASTTNGAQHNILQNNTISLSNSYVNTFGIYSNVRHSATNAIAASGISNATTGPNSSNKVYGNFISNVNYGIVFIGSEIAANMDTGNDIGGSSLSTGNSITNWGRPGSPSAYYGNLATYTASYYGINMNCQKADNTSYNTILSSTLTGSAAVVRGIVKSYRSSTSSGTIIPGGTFTTTIQYNSITLSTNLPNNSHVDGILTENLSSDSSSLYVDYNIIQGMSIQNSGSTNQMRGINNTSRVSILKISNNVIRGNTSTSTGGFFTAINQSGNIITRIDIDNNKIGDSTTGGDAITYLSSPLGVNSALRAINNSNTNGTLYINILSNNIQGFRQLGSLTTAPHYYIECSHSTSTNSIFDISHNTFTNLAANTSGDVYFIRGTGTMAINAGAQANVTQNSIIGSFSKNIAGGNVYFYYAAGSSLKGNSMRNFGNNFSNVSTTGNSAIYGWTNVEGIATGEPVKIISNNIFKNWISTGSSATTTYAIYLSNSSGNSEISNNTISEISCLAHLNGMLSASTIADTLSITSNVINGLNSSFSTALIAGLRLSALSRITKVQNQMIGITSTSGSTVYGIYASAATVNSSLFVNYNTVYLKATSSTSGFSSGALFLTASSTATSARAFVRNNILVNESTPGTSGKSVALRRSGASLSNFDSTSNNNVFYTSAFPSSSTPVYFDGVNARDTLGSYRAWLVINSFTNTENKSLYDFPNFVSTSIGLINLNLMPTMSSEIFKGGNNNGILLDKDIDSNARMVMSPYVTSIGAHDVSIFFQGNPNTINLVDCNQLISTRSCNLIPNAVFSYTVPSPPPYPSYNGAGIFSDGYVDSWTSISYGTPDIGGAFYSVPTLPPAISALGIPVNSAGLQLSNCSNCSTFPTWFEGIAAKTEPIHGGKEYMFSFFVSSTQCCAQYNLKVILTNCQEFPTTFPAGPPYPAMPPLNIQGIQQEIFCQLSPAASGPIWTQYVVTFTATNNFDMLVIYPQLLTPSPRPSISTYLQILYPELVDLDPKISIANNSSCEFVLNACGVTNSTYEWFDANNVSLGTTSEITVDPNSNPGNYSVQLCVPNILNNPLLNGSCSDNVGCIAAIAVVNSTWAGTISKDWNTASNWDPAIVPNSSTTSVNIPSGTPFSPEILYQTPNEFQINNLTISSGAMLINNGWLKIAGEIHADIASIDNYYTDINSNVRSIAGSIEMNGTCTIQNLAGNVFWKNDVKNFKASNNVIISDFNTSPTEWLDVHGELSFGTTSTTLTTGDNLTLVSNASTTANVAQIDPTNFIDGQVTVERFIKTGTGIGEHARTWQMLATPTGANSIGQTVKQAWMENQITTPPVGYGTHIPDPRVDWSTRGFDFAFGGASATAIKTYNEIIQNFVAISNTTIPLYNKNGYFLFVRGDRYIDQLNLDPNPTNMRSKGALFQPQSGYTPTTVTAPAWTFPSTGKYVMVGNPYASAIDLSYMYNTTGYCTNLDGIFVVWDVSIPGTQGYGGYQYLDANATIPFSPTSPGPGGSGNYYETLQSYPEIQSGQAFFVKANPNGISGTISFNENVKTGNSRIVTRTSRKKERKSLWSGLYSNTGICDGNSVTFDEEYSNDLGVGDVSKLANSGENFMIVRGDALLAIEKRQPTNKSDTIFYTFNNLRLIKYQLVFAPYMLQDDLRASLIDRYLHTKVYLSLEDTTIFDFVVDANKASFENRFMVVFERSSEEIVKSDNQQSAVTIYPNPVKNKIVKLKFENQSEGKYSVLIINQAGQTVYNTSINIHNQNTTTNLKLNTNVVNGIYNLILISESGKRTVEKIIVQ